MATQQRGRFWGGDDSSESEDSSSSSGSEADEAGRVGPSAKAAASRFATVESDSSSEDEGRVARSAKDRTYEGLLSAIKAINNQLKINNWVGVQEGACVRAGWPPGARARVGVHRPREPCRHVAASLPASQQRQLLPPRRARVAEAHCLPPPPLPLSALRRL